MPARLDVRQYVIDTWRSGTISAVCPVCEGGNGKEVSFNVFEVDDNVLGYKCHRSSCGAAGRVMVLGGVGRPERADKSRSLSIVPAEPGDADEYEKQFGLQGPTVATFNGKRWFVATLRDFHGARFGWQRRIINKALLADGERKAFTHKDIKSPLAYYRNSPFNRTLVVVEDPWSAMRIEKLASLRMDAAAICGGDWTEAMAREVATHSDNYSKVVLALDRDAQDRAIKSALRFKHIQPVRIVVPRIDFKNMDDDGIIATLTGKEK